MNRAEELIEALKEADKVLVALLLSNTRVSAQHGDEAFDRVKNITEAILTERDAASTENTKGVVHNGFVLETIKVNNENISLKAQNDLIAAECERLESENQNLRDELNVISGECNGLRAEVQERIMATVPSPNPALENVLAKLRSAVGGMNASGGKEDGFVISAFCAPYLTLGDLRRWVESEKGAGK